MRIPVRNFLFIKLDVLLLKVLTLNKFVVHNSFFRGKFSTPFEGLLFPREIALTKQVPTNPIFRHRTIAPP